VESFQKRRQGRLCQLSGLLIIFEAAPFGPRGVFEIEQGSDQRGASDAIDKMGLKDFADVSEQSDQNVLVAIASASN
jgi:hypothetical protein